ncbi:unnamed protein product, partial [Owenia fusiformis]
MNSKENVSIVIAAIITIACAGTIDHVVWGASADGQTGRMASKIFVEQDPYTEETVFDVYENGVNGFDYPDDLSIESEEMIDAGGYPMELSEEIEGEHYEVEKPDQVEERKTVENVNPVCPGYFRDLNDCRSYFICDHFGKSVRMNCPGGLWWSPIILTCVSPENEVFSNDSYAKCVVPEITESADPVADSPPTHPNEPTVASSQNSYEDGYAKGYVYATCTVRPNEVPPAGETQLIKGTVDFRQMAAGGKTEIKVSLQGFDTTDANIYHGFHVHGTGDLSNGCQSTGGHYNPFSKTHGAPSDSERHVGDLGNIMEDNVGLVQTTITDSQVSIVGTYSIYGRAIVVHQKRDDLGRGGDAGSKATGNAGGRLA